MPPVCHNHVWNSVFQHSIGNSLFCQRCGTLSPLCVAYQDLLLDRDDPAGEYLFLFDFLLREIHTPDLHVAFLIRSQFCEEIFLDVLLCSLCGVYICAFSSSIFGSISVFFQNTADFVLRYADAVLLQQSFQGSSTEATVVTPQLRNGKIYSFLCHSAKYAVAFLTYAGQHSPSEAASPHLRVGLPSSHRRLSSRLL